MWHQEQNTVTGAQRWHRTQRASTRSFVEAGCTLGFSVSGWCCNLSVGLEGPRQRLRIQPIVFLAALPDQPHLARVGHDHFMPQLAQQPLTQGECFPISSAIRLCGMAPKTSCSAFALVRTRCSSRIWPASSTKQYQLWRSPTSNQMVSFCCEIFLLCPAALVLPFFIAGLLFICALSTSITWKRTPHPVRRPGFSSHLVTTVCLNCPWLGDKAQRHRQSTVKLEKLVVEWSSARPALRDSILSHWGCLTRTETSAACSL
jgi:hypothetical protein